LTPRPSLRYITYIVEGSQLKLLFRGLLSFIVKLNMPLSMPHLISHPLSTTALRCSGLSAFLDLSEHCPSLAARFLASETKFNVVWYRGTSDLTSRCELGPTLYISSLRQPYTYMFVNELGRAKSTASHKFPLSDFHQVIIDFGWFTNLCSCSSSSRGGAVTIRLPSLIRGPDTSVIGLVSPFCYKQFTLSLILYSHPNRAAFINTLSISHLALWLPVNSIL
jgi:hypothetical protein